MTKPVVDMIMTVWPRGTARIKYFEETIKALRENLTYSGGELRWHCFSESKMLNPKADAKQKDLCKQYDIRLVYRPGPPGLGMNMNFALHKTRGDYVFYMQDDWLLEGPLDLAEGVEFHQQHPKYIYLRYYWLGQGMPKQGVAEGHLEHLDGPFYRMPPPKVAPAQFSHNPYLAHRSFYKRMGKFIKAVSNESDMRKRVTHKKLPVAVHNPSVFRHIGKVTTLQKRYFNNMPAKLNCDKEAQFFDEQARASGVALDRLRQLLINQRPRRILELGSGLTTYLMLKYLSVQKWHDETQLLSLEHDERYYNPLQSCLENSGYSPEARAQVVLAPLKDNLFYDVDSLYAAGKLSQSDQFDFIFIDGPPTSARRNNEACRQFLRRHACPQGIIVVDDTHRKGEQRLADFAEKLLAAPVSRKDVQARSHKRTSTVLFSKKYEPVRIR